MEKRDRRKSPNTTSTRRAFFRWMTVVFLIVSMQFLSVFNSDGAEIYIDRTGTIQLDLNDLTDGASNDLRNDLVVDFNYYASRWDVKNPIEWTHTWDLSVPSDGNLPLDPGESFSSILAAELFPVIWDIDYPSNTEHDVLYWDSGPYAGAAGSMFSMASNIGPDVRNLGYVQGNNNLWGAKRISLDPALLAPGDVEYFWLQIDEDPAGVNWLTSIDYSDLAIIFNTGNVNVEKTLSSLSGFNPPRVGYTTNYVVRIDISNRTLTSTGGPMYEVKVTDNFPPGSSIVTAPTLGSATLNGAGVLVWDVGILEDGALNVPAAPGSTDFMEVLVPVRPVQGQVGLPVVLNAGANISGVQVPQDPGDGTGVLYPFNYYTDPANTDTDVSAGVQSLEVAAANTGVITMPATIIPGNNVAVSVTDPDLNFSTSTIEIVNVTVVNLATAESEQITLTETGISTGVFTSSVATIFGAVAGLNNTGSLNVKAGDILRGTYNDLYDANGNAAAITADTTVLGGDTGTITVNSPINPGDSITVNVTDADLDTDPAVAETFSLITTNTRTGESESTLYTETGVNTGVFSATINTLFGVAPGANNSGSFNCISGDILRTQYTDALTAIGNSATVTGDSQVVGGSDGVILLTASIFPGETITVTVVDTDLDVNPAVAESKTVTLKHGTTGETESVTLTETGVSTGVFTGTVASSFGAGTGTGGNGSFTVQAGSIITGTYTDTLTGAGGSATVTASTTVIGGTDATLSATPSVLPGQSPIFTISDADLNTNPAAAEIYIYTLTNTLTGEKENVQFTETAANSGLFKGTVSTIFNLIKGPDNDGLFQVLAGHFIRLSYTDNLTAIGGQNNLSVNSAIKGGVNASISSTPSETPGNSLTCTLSDTDLNTNAATIQTIVVTALDTITGETELLTLAESDVNSGVFIGTVATVLNPATGVDNDGSFNVIGGHNIKFSHTDSLAANGGTLSISAVSILVDNTNFVTITSPTGSQNNAVHNVTGQTDPYSTVSMQDPVTGGIVTVPADASGDYIFPAVVFPEGPTTFTVTSIDLAGNIAADASTIIVDTSNFILVGSPPPGSVINTTQVAVSGTTDPGATVTLVEPVTGVIFTVIADSSGAFSIPVVKLPEGASVLPFTSVDTLGNTATTNIFYNVDLNISLNITSLAEGASYNSSSHEIGGITDANATVTTTHPTLGTTLSSKADASGKYTFGFFNFTDGAKTVTVNSKDDAGNTAQASVNFLIDTTNINTIFNTGTYTTPLVDITGTTDPGSTVKMSHPLSGSQYTTKANAAGNYTIGSVPFPDGTYTVTTRSTDPLGNIAVDSATFTVDSTIKLVVQTPPNNSVTTINFLNISGVTDPAAVVSMVSPGTDIDLFATADNSGAFTIVGVTLNDWQNIMTIRSTDPAGNTTTVNHTLYYYPFLSLVIETPADGSVVRNNIQDVTGTTEPNVNLYTYDPLTGQMITTVSAADGTYIFPGVEFPDGRNTITVYAYYTDAFGNTISTSSSSSFVVADTGVTAQLEVSERVVFGNPIFIRVTDPETYLSQTVRDSVTVAVTSPGGDSETVTLIETSGASGIFEGRLNTVETAGSDGMNSGTLSVQYGDTVTTTYTDVIQADGSLDVTLSAQTLITNDEIRLNVQVTTITGEVSLEPLSDSGISIIEFNPSGSMAGLAFNYTTSIEGFIPTEFVGRMRSGMSYRVLLQEFFMGEPYSQSESFDIATIQAIVPDNRGVRTLVIVLDPAGYVYDALSGARIDGADVTFYHESGAAVAGPFAFFTHSPARAQVNPQLSGLSGVPGGFEFIGSGAGSDVTAGNYYITVTFDTNPALGNTYAGVLKNTTDSWAGISEPYTGQVFLVDVNNQPVGMRVPLMSSINTLPLQVQKISNKESATTGDVVTFSVTVTNTTTTATDPNSPVILEDTLPVGLTYLKGSAVFDNGAAVPVQQTGNNLLFFLTSLAAAGNAAGDDSITIYYQAVIDTSARPGDYLVNTVVAQINQIVMSAPGTAAVNVVPDPIFDLSTIIGKVFEDTNGNGRQDDGEKGVGGVGVVMETGDYVITDKHGRFSIPAVEPAAGFFSYRVLSVDKATLPIDAKFTTSRTAMVKTTAGTTSRAMFGVVVPGAAGVLSGGGSGATVPRGQREDGLYEKTASNLFSGILDLALGEIKYGAGETNIPDLDIFPEGGYSFGRAAFFFDGMMKQLRLTAAFDSARRNIFDMDDSYEGYMLYPTYGDSSRLSNLVNSRGSFFMDARTEGTRLLYGNFDAEFRGTELAGIRRSLHGALLEIRRMSNVEEYILRDRLTIFTAADRQLQARSELRASGGTHYYTAHQYLSSGSEKVTVEIRDSFAPDRVLTRNILKTGEDYEIDYITGRLRLFTPLAAYADGNLISSSGVGDGNPVWIVIDYIFRPLKTEPGTLGARWEHQVKDFVVLGTSFLRENVEGQDHLLSAVDFHLKGESGKELLRLELARSKAGGIPWLSSLDGGRSWVELGATGKTQGTAFKAAHNFEFKSGISMESYYYAVDSDFTGQAFSERGMKRGGTTLTFVRGNEEWRGDYTRGTSKPGANAQSLVNSGGGRSRSARIGWSRIYETARLTIEYFHRYNTASTTASGFNRGAFDSITARYEKHMSDRITMFLKQQNTVSNYHNQQASVGVSYRMRKDMSFTAEGTLGSHGSGGRLGFEKSRGDGTRIYFDAESGYSTEKGTDAVSTTAGVQAKAGKNTTAYIEYGAESAGAISTLRRAVGLNKEYDAGGGFKTVISAERSEESTSTSGKYLANSVTFQASHDVRGERIISSSIEYRRMSGGLSREQFGYRLEGNTPEDREISLHTEYEYITSEDLLLKATESKYTRGIVGLAYRPVEHDRLNLFLKMGRIRELRTRAADVVMNPDTLTTVLSLEGVYELSSHVLLREKIASKRIFEKTGILPLAKTRTTLWITGFNWKLSRKWDLDAEYRTQHQPAALNHQDGIALELGCRFSKNARAAIGYNFSSYSDDEFDTESYSRRGFLFGLQVTSR